jgi:hypothetical protein
MKGVVARQFKPDASGSGRSGSGKEESPDLRRIVFSSIIDALGLNSYLRRLAYNGKERGANRSPWRYAG